MARFQRYIGIDYSGAGGPDDPLPGLCAYGTDTVSRIRRLAPGEGRRWSRNSLCERLIDMLKDGPPTIVGIDHGFAFPTIYYDTHRLDPSWDSAATDFAHHWPSDRYPLSLIRTGKVGAAATRWGLPTWRRECEKQSGSAKSVFQFDVHGTVAHSTHSGIPQLLRIRRALPSIHLWPFDGWTPPIGSSVIAEAYPRLYGASKARGRRTADEQDAYAIARWLRDSDARDGLGAALLPSLSPRQRAIGKREGWILGVDGGASLIDRKGPEA